MDKKNIIRLARNHVKAEMKNDSAHDFSHIMRVCKLARFIAEKEKADIFIVELAALLHDIGDWKYNNLDEEIGARRTEDLLKKLGVDEKTIVHVSSIVRHISFKGGTEKKKMSTLEGKCVQDADRLDALGAIGIARAFAVGATFNREMHNLKKSPKKFKDAKDVMKRQTTTINHFYEKLLLLKDRMNTNTAKMLAKERHDFMISFLKQFYKEWDLQYSLK